MKSFIVVIIGLCSCNEPSEEFKQNFETEQNLEISTPADSIGPDIFPENCELMTTIYKIDSSMQDSTLICTEYLFIDQSKSKVGKCYYRLPFEIDAISVDLLERLKKEQSVETFDPTICEVGGHSAYNKYQFTDKDNGHYEVHHYKAWYEDYTAEGEPVTHEHPEYFLGEKISITENNHFLKLCALNAEGDVIESIENFYNENGILIRQKWFNYGTTLVSHFVYSF